MNNITFTQTGVDALKKEQVALQIERKEAVVDLKKAREMGDLSENGYYKAAKLRLGAIDRRIRMVAHLLKSAHIPTVVAKETIDIGCYVTIADEQGEKTYELVGGYESNPSEGKLSIISPIGRALVGRRKGDTIEINAPSGKMTYTILSFRYT